MSSEQESPETDKTASAADGGGSILKKDIKLGALIRNNKPTLVILILIGLGAAGYFFIQKQQEIAAMKRPWILQAQSLGRAAGMSLEELGQLEEAYVSQRLQFKEVTADIAEGNRIAFFQMLLESRTKLHVAIADLVPEEEFDSVYTPMAAFDSRYDEIVMAMADLGLEEDTMYEALAHVNKFVAELAKAQEAAIRGSAGPTMSDAIRMRKEAQEQGKTVEMPKPKTKEEIRKQREMQRKMQQAFVSNRKMQLDSALAEYMTDEQMATWKETSSFDL